MKNRLNRMQIIRLVCFSSVTIEGKKYKLPWLIGLIKFIINFSFIMGGIFGVSLILGQLLEVLNVKIYFGYIHIFSIILILIVNILIVKFSSLVEIEDNKVDINKAK